MALTLSLGFFKVETSSFIRMKLIDEDSLCIPFFEDLVVIEIMLAAGRLCMAPISTTLLVSSFTRRVSNIFFP